MKYFLILLSLIVITGCDMMTRTDVKKQDEERQLKEQVSAIQKNRADSEMKYGDVQNDLRVIAGRVDTLDHNQNQNQITSRQEIDELKKTIERQNDKIKILEQHVDATEQRLLAAIQAGAAVTAPTPSRSEHAAGAKEGKKGESDTFTEAEGLLAEKEFKRAIVKYQSYRDKNPKGAHAAEATYKIGVCFSELGMKKDSKEFYKETLETYPQTPAAKKAKYRLNQLK